MVRVTQPISAATFAEMERRASVPCASGWSGSWSYAAAVLAVTFADRSVEFRADARAREIDFIRREIAPSTTRNIVIRANKGW